MTLGLRAPFVILFPLLIDDTCTPPWETCTEECFHPTHPTAVSLLDDRFSRALAVPGYFLPPSTIYFAPYCARHLGFFLLLRWLHTLCLPCRAAHPSPSEKAQCLTDRLAVVCFACSLLNPVRFLLPIPLLTHIHTRIRSPNVIKKTVDKTDTIFIQRPVSDLRWYSYLPNPCPPSGHAHSGRRPHTRASTSHDSPLLAPFRVPTRRMDPSRRGPNTGMHQQAPGSFSCHFATFSFPYKN